ncbi:hypothetical protein POM88_051295 [Heracleum sosnowskyi]|uniref:Uncharacterized protein n=1 Tax=Heracleum sosnowskyi TaxID=360622 RepID=A0AAD8M398_9APIA|nr:hypothetical protein POM88_051295 [Heracleum sosnowskyi]
MASKAIRAKAMLRGTVKAVPSGDTLVIMSMGDTASTEIPPERTIVLSSLMAPKLARRGGKQTTDEPWAWQSREFLRNICIGKEVKFQVDYTLPQRGLEFGNVFLGDKNVAFYVVAHGWAKLKTVRDLDKDRGEFSPYLKELKKWEDKAKENGAGCWSKASGSVRNLPPSLVGDPNKNGEITRLVVENKGTEVQAIVEYVRDGSTLHVYLLPDYQHVRVFVAGVQAPSMRNWMVEPVKAEANGKPSNGSRGPLTSAQKVVASSTSVTQGAPEDFARESKHFTEIRVLHREVRIFLEGVDIHGKLIGRVRYLDGQPKDLAEQLVENGLAKFVDCGKFLPVHIKQRLKSSELKAKESRLRMWNNYISPPSDNTAITSKYVEEQKVSNGQATDRKLKGELQVVATEVVGGGKFYVQLTDYQKEASIIQQQLASLKLQEAPALGSFNPDKGELVLAQFRGDNSWNRAMIVDVPQGVARSAKARFEVFYIDYGTQELVAYSRLRPWDYSVNKSPGLAHLCGLAHVKVPGWKENYGKEAAQCLSNHILHGQKEFKAIIEERNSLGAGTILMVTLMDTKAKICINAAMVKDGFARLEDAAVATDELKNYQEEARKQRLGMWKMEISSLMTKKPTGDFVA